MAFSNGKLYVNFRKSYTNLGTYVIDNNSAELIFDVSNVAGSMTWGSPKFEQHGDEIYVWLNYEYKLLDQEDYTLGYGKYCDYNKGGACMYAEGDVIVSSDDSGTYVNYKDSEPYTIPYNDEMEDSFYVYGDYIYYLTKGSKLCRIDTKNGDGKTEELNYLTRTEIPLFTVCGDTVYFFSEEKESTKYNYDKGLYSYSLKNGEMKLLKASDDAQKFLPNTDVICMNCIDNHFYYCGRDGIFTVEGDTVKRISSTPSAEIYLFDKDWIYAYGEDDSVFRVSVDGKTTERIDYRVYQ